MAEEWKRKADKAAAMLNKMREDYFKELMHLREQVYRKGKASEVGEQFHPDYAVHFNPSEYSVDVEVQRLVSIKEIMLEQEYDARLGEVEVGYMSRIRDLKDQVFSARFLQRRNHELLQVLKDRFGLDSAALRGMLESTKINEEKLKAQIEDQAAEAERRAVEAYRESVSKQQQLEQQLQEKQLEQQLVERRLQQRQERRASTGTVELGANEGMRVRSGGLRRRSQGPDGHVLHALEVAARAPHGAGDGWSDLCGEGSDGVGEEAEPDGDGLGAQARAAQPRRRRQAQVSGGAGTDPSSRQSSQVPLIAKETAEVGTDPQAFHEAFGAPLLQTRGVQSEIDGRMLAKALDAFAECDCAVTVALRARRPVRGSVGEKSLAEVDTDTAGADSDAAADDTDQRLAGRTNSADDLAVPSSESDAVAGGGSLDATRAQDASGGVTGARGPDEGPPPASVDVGEVEALLQELQQALPDVGSALPGGLAAGAAAAARLLALLAPPRTDAEAQAETPQEATVPLRRRWPSPRLGLACMRWLSELACPELRCFLESAWERAEELASEAAPSDSSAMRLLQAWLQEGPFSAPQKGAAAPRGQANDGRVEQKPRSPVRGIYFNSLVACGEESSRRRASVGHETSTVQFHTRQTVCQSPTSERGRKLKHTLTLPNPEQPQLLGLPGITDVEQSTEPGAATLLPARGKKLRHTLSNPEQPGLVPDSRPTSKACTARGDPQGSKELLSGRSGPLTPDDAAPTPRHHPPAPAVGKMPSIGSARAPGEASERRTARRATMPPTSSAAEAPSAKPPRRASYTIKLPTGAPTLAERPRSEDSSDSGLGPSGTEEEPRLAPGWSGVVPPASFTPRRNQEAVEPGAAQAAAPPQDPAAGPAAAGPPDRPQRRAARARTVSLLLPSIAPTTDPAETPRAPAGKGAGGDRTDDEQSGGQALADDAAPGGAAGALPGRPSGKATRTLLQLPDHTGMQISLGSSGSGRAGSPSGAPSDPRSARRRRSLPDSYVSAASQPPVH
ncbi:unnamed protein product [Prorocentrum cordatum]|uniref:Uncharacterized protein n=1 Tax=Prorocentrum cordatum TaxID=2364126 RepID=A0ABN9WDN6_9DINO|nr:unnamed protein product [Polarella glacialis]